MNAMVSGFALSLLIMGGAYVALNQGTFSSASQYSGEAVRLD